MNLEGLHVGHDTFSGSEETTLEPRLGPGERIAGGRRDLQRPFRLWQMLLLFIQSSIAMGR